MHKTSTRESGVLSVIIDRESGVPWAITDRYAHIPNEHVPHASSYMSAKYDLEHHELPGRIPATLTTATAI
jgi:hypothetical protein